MVEWIDNWGIDSTLELLREYMTENPTQFVVRWIAELPDPSFGILTVITTACI